MLLSRSCDLPQVRDFAANLHRILLDTIKMKEAHEVCIYSVDGCWNTQLYIVFLKDPAVLMDLMYRISKGWVCTYVVVSS